MNQYVFIIFLYQLTDLKHLKSEWTSLESRVSACQQRVNDLIDLQLCSDGVKSAIADEDYEQAAAHLHRFLSMDEGKEAVQCGFVDCIVI